MRAALRPYATILKVVVVLVLVEIGVRTWFFDSEIVPAYGTQFRMLRDRTSAHAWSIVLNLIERTPKHGTRIAMVGDSTMVGTDDIFDEYSIPFMVREELRRRSLDVDVVDCSQVGMFAADAALIVNDIARRDVDLVLYGLTLRAFADLRYETSHSHIRREQGVVNIASLVAAGSGEWLWDTLSVAQFTDGLAYSTWWTYAYRQQLKRYVWHSWLKPRLPVLPLLDPGPAYLPLEVKAPRYLSRPLRDQQYGYPNQNWLALEVIGRICERIRPRRCALYTGPVNPKYTTDFADPQLYADYLARVRTVAGRYRVPWRDLTNVLAATQFRKPNFYSSYETDPIHPNRDGGLVIAAKVADMIEPIIRSR